MARRHPRCYWKGTCLTEFFGFELPDTWLWQVREESLDVLRAMESKYASDDGQPKAKVYIGACGSQVHE